MKKIITTVLAALIAIAAFSQKNHADVQSDYRRSSLYNILIIHPQQKFAEDVRQVYYQSPFPDKFNNHSLSVLSIVSDEPKKYEDQEAVTKFLENNNVAQRLVAKWFERDRETGTFDIGYLAKCGLYDADAMDVEISSLTKRGSAMLADAGEEMIKNTFVVVYDIVYVDKEENAQKAKEVFGWIKSFANIAGSIAGLGNIGDMVGSIADLGSSISDMIAGFTVKVTSHLYQLEWNEETADKFYSRFYMSRGESDSLKKEMWNTAGHLYTLKYIGSNEERSEKTVTRGLYSPQDVIRKVVNRSMDKSLASLQKDHEVFRVKVPVNQVEGNVIRARIGLKEGVSNTSVYEILERRFDESTGRTRYKKVGEASPISGRIWDNRYMAEEEGADNADMTYTEFAITSGSGIYAGMLLREGKSKPGAVIPAPSSVHSLQEDGQKASVKAGSSVQKTGNAAVKPNQEYSGRIMIMPVLGFDLFNKGDFSSQKLTYGLSAGWVKRWGGYAKFKTNAVFPEESGSISYDLNNIWTTGNTKIQNWSVSAGALFAVIPQLYLNFGASYGVKKIYWEDINQNWKLIIPYSVNGIGVDVGLTARFSAFSIGLGSSFLFNTNTGYNSLYIEPEIKIGVMF